MPDPSNRTQRRQAQRAPQKRRWSFFRLGWILCGIAGLALVIMIVAYNVASNRAVNAVTVTPSPRPNDSGGIQLANGSSLGAALFPPRDAVRGGQGQPVDGIKCESSEFATLHVHAHLALFVKGRQIQVPQGIGFPSSGSQCLYWLHTHDASGIIHVESPSAGPFTFGNLFDVWGEPLSSNQVASVSGDVRVFVNGARFRGDPRSIPISAHEQVILEVGAPFVSPPYYLFPAHE